MRTLKFIVFAVCILAIALGTAPATADDLRDLGAETLPPLDGWAAEGSGTTGGAAAAPDHIYTVHNRQELVAALNDGVYPPPGSTPSSAPKIIYVSGVIDGNVDDNNQPLTCQDYARDGFTLEAFLAAYDPAVWGRAAIPSTAPLEKARVASREAQKARIQIPVGSNTTLVGLGSSATIRGIQLDLRGTSSVQRTNIIIRNLNFRDTFDCFPAWSPTDGSAGSWNAEYDAIAVRQTHHVWVDHNTFQDLDTIDSQEPSYFGVHFERHDGLVDITNGSDLVTVSWNHFLNHDKTMLIGSSDSGSTAAGDRGKLRVTLHHNWFENLGQRVPRVRFGKVHVYNNYYQVGAETKYVYSWGVGIESAIYAQNNYFESAVTPDKFIGVYKGTQIFTEGTFVNGHAKKNQVDVLAAFNAVNSPDLSGNVGWTPTYFIEIQPTQSLPGLVPAQAGPVNW